MALRPSIPVNLSRAQSLGTSWLTFKTVTLAAQSVRIENVTGSVFICRDATAQFKMGFGDRSEYFPMQGGMGFRLEAGDYFSRITLQNDTNEAITLTYYLGQTEVLDYRLGRSNASTYLTGWAETSLDAGATESFAGTSGDDYRKAIVVTNLDGSSDLQILDSSDQVAATIPPGTAWTIECGGTIKVKNPSAGTVNVNVAQIWYDL